HRLPRPDEGSRQKGRAGACQKWHRAGRRSRQSMWARLRLRCVSGISPAVSDGDQISVCRSPLHGRVRGGRQMRVVPELLYGQTVSHRALREIAALSIEGGMMLSLVCDTKSKVAAQAALVRNLTAVLTNEGVRRIG